MKKKILITGGAGFLGINLANYLLRNFNVDILILDNLISSDFSNISKLSSQKIKFIKHDIRKPFSFKCDLIYNLACPASPPHYQKNSILTLETNSIGSKNSFNLAKKNNCTLLHTSTSEIYGNPLESPQKEKYFGNVNSFGPRACYDEGKRYAEALAYEYIRNYKTDIRIVRIFNTYGPYMSVNDGRVVSNFICKAIKNDPIEIYGNGYQTRSFCYVDDLIRGMVKFSLLKKINSRIYNLGNPNEINLIKLSKLILKITKSQSKVIYKKMPIDDPKRRKPDISLAKKELNWYPKVKLEVGIKKTVNYFKKNV